MRIVLLGFIYFQISHTHAEEWKKALTHLSSPSFEMRQEAEKSIKTYAKSLKTLAEVNSVLNVLYTQHKKTQDPEMYVRLSKTLMDVCTIHRKKRGKAFAGIGWNRNGGVEHQVKLNEQTVYNAICINSVKKDTPADKAGLKVGDRITHIGDIDMRHITATLARTDFPLIIQSFAPGEQIKIQYYRGKEKKSCSLTLIEVPQIYKDQTVSLSQPYSENDDLRYFKRWYKAKELEEKK